LKFRKFLYGDFWPKSEISLAAPARNTADSYAAEHLVTLPKTASAKPRKQPRVGISEAKCTSTQKNGPNAHCCSTSPVARKATTDIGKKFAAEKSAIPTKKQEIAVPRDHEVLNHMLESFPAPPRHLNAGFFFFQVFPLVS